MSFFDTSDVYGYKSTKEGMSAEHLLGRFTEESRVVSSRRRLRPPPPPPLT